jgi:hypothetical protein
LVEDTHDKEDCTQSKGLDVPMRWLLTLIIIGMVFLHLKPLSGAEEASLSSPTAEDDAARQLRIYREALLQGSTEEIRVDAAIGLLLNRDTASRDLLVSALRLSDNPGASKAVCKALIKSRAVGTTIGSRDMFLEPLLQLLAGVDVGSARLAAEALLVFRFGDIDVRLNEMSHDTTLDKPVRFNVIYALQIRPEPQALSDLIKLLDEPDTEVARAAETALQEAFGIPVGTGRPVWEQILNDLKQKSPDDIRRERLLRQEMKLREIQTERDRWQRLYLGVLDKQYETADETSRTAMVLERLDSDLPAIRLWALDRVDRNPANGQAALREKLLTLLNDDSRLVRLKTARVLNNMSALNPAERLLERFRLEKDPEVSLAMFEALGEACFFAFSPGSKIELPEGVKLETLEIAGGYLNSEDIETAKKGAEIVRKLLELNSLPQEQAVYYLERLVQRYELSVQRNTALRGDLLGMMARLCGRGAQRERAAKMYLPYFADTIGVTDNPSVRLAAATGLSNVDAALALKLFKQHDLIQKGSPALRQLIIEAASQAGQPEDMEWLAGLLVSNGQADPALLAFRAICQRADGRVASEWAVRLDATDLQVALVRELLEIAEQKALTGKNEILLSEVRVRLAEWFVRRQTPEQLVAYLDRVKASGGSMVFPDATGARLLEALILGGHYHAAADIVNVRLERASLRKDSLILAKLDEFFQSNQVVYESKKAFLEILVDLKVNQANPLWSSKIKAWKDMLGLESVAAVVSEKISN